MHGVWISHSVQDEWDLTTSLTVECTSSDAVYQTIGLPSFTGSHCIAQRLPRFLDIVLSHTGLCCVICTPRFPRGARLLRLLGSSHQPIVVDLQGASTVIWGDPRAIYSLQSSERFTFPSIWVVIQLATDNGQSSRMGLNREPMDLR